jgi:hypothetical protein
MGGFPKINFCSGSLNPDSPLTGMLPLEGECLDEETTVIFSVEPSGCPLRCLRSLIPFL